MKRILATLIALALLLSLVCVAAADDSVTLSVAFWGDKSEIETKLKLMEQFEAAHPNIHIEPTYTDGGTYQAKLQTWFASNTAPDVLGTASDLIYPYKDMGVLEDLTPYIQKDHLMEDGAWAQASVDAFTFDGRVFSAPYVYKDLAIAYNKSIFDAAGIAYPSADWTESEFLDICRKLTVGEGPEKQWGIRLSTYPTNFYRNMFGQPTYLRDELKMNAAGNDEYRHAMELLSSMVLEGLSPNETFETSFGSGFESGRFAMAICAPWDMGTFDSLIGDSFAWDIQVLPFNETFNTTWKSYLFADGFAMSSKCKNKEAAWELIKWLTASEEAQKVSEGFGVPMYLPYANSEEYLNNYTTQTKYTKKVFVDMLPNCVGGETTGVWAQINDIMNTEFQRIITGEIDVNTAIDNVQQLGESMLFMAQ